jgi:hypothetical protein
VNSGRSSIVPPIISIVRQDGVILCKRESRSAAVAGMVSQASGATCCESLKIIHRPQTRLLYKENYIYI